MAADDAMYGDHQVTQKTKNRSGLHYLMTVESLCGDFSLSEVRDIAILSNNNLAVAQKMQMTEFDPDGRVVRSRWRPPTCCFAAGAATGIDSSVSEKDDNIMSFGALRDDRLLVALYNSKRLVVLSRSNQSLHDTKAGDEQSLYSWRIKAAVPLSHLPQCISCCGDMVAVASTFVGGDPPPIKLLSLTDENIGKTLISRPMTVAVGWVALTKSLFIISPWTQARSSEALNGGRSYVEAYSVTGAQQWRLSLDVTVRCMRVGSQGGVLYLIGNDGGLRVIDCETCSVLADSVILSKPLNVISMAILGDNTLVMVGSVRNAIAIEDSQNKRHIDMTFFMKANVVPSSPAD